MLVCCNCLFLKLVLVFRTRNQEQSRVVFCFYILFSYYYSCVLFYCCYPFPPPDILSCRSPTLSTIATTAPRHSPPFSLQLVPPASTTAVHHPSPLLSHHCSTLPFRLHLSPSTVKICSQNKFIKAFIFSYL